MTTQLRTRLLATLVLFGVLGSTSHSQGTAAGTRQHLSARASQVLVPQNGSFRWRDDQPEVRITGVKAHIAIVEQVATTTLDVSLHNPGGRQAEAELVLPVPRGAAVTGFDFQGAAETPTARLLPADEARAIYDEIVRRAKDPALLEFLGYGLIQSSVFPVPAGGTQSLRVTFQHLLEADGARVDYHLPRSESLAVNVPWSVTIDLRSKDPISTLYSSSHELDTERHSASHLAARMVHTWGSLTPGSLRLSYLRQQSDLTATLMACPEEGLKEGTFLLLAGLPADLEAELAKRGNERLKREVTLVLDRSGSMSGAKLQQAVAAAKQILGGLEAGEYFRIVDYSDEVARFSDTALQKTPESVAAAMAYLDGLVSRGGTDIYHALAAALEPEPNPDTLSLVLFLTDGLPTSGPTSEAEIRTMVEARNTAGRRIFAFGVGNDVNAPLLDRLSDSTRGTSTYVVPGEDVEVAVGGVFKELVGPVLTDLELSPLQEKDAPAAVRVSHMLPRRLPDLYEGDQLVVLGRYHGTQPLSFRLRAEFLGEPRVFEMRFPTDGADPRNTFIANLWATRRIADLVDGVRQAGAQGATSVAQGKLLDDPRYKEIADEVLRLSTRYGILSEYTSFLAREGTSLASWEGLGHSNRVAFERYVVTPRSGVQAVTTARNWKAQEKIWFSNNSNVFLQGPDLLPPLQQPAANSQSLSNNQRPNAAGAAPVLAPIGGVQQVANRALFRRGERWIDSRLVGTGDDLEPQRTIEWGTEEFTELVERFAGDGTQGVLAFRGELLLELDGERVLVRNAGSAAPAPGEEPQVDRAPAPAAGAND